MKILLLMKQSDYSKNLLQDIYMFCGDSITVDEVVEPNNTLSSCLKRCRKTMPSLIIIDSGFMSDQVKVEFSKNIYSGEVSPKICCLLTEREKADDNGIGNCIYFYKGIENKDLLLYIQRVLGIKISKTIEDSVVKVDSVRQLKSHHYVSVDYIKKDYTSLLTNYCFKPNSIQMMNLPFSKRYIRSHKHVVTNVEEKNIHGHYRNRANIDFKFFTIPLKKESSNLIMHQFIHEHCNCIVDKKSYGHWLEADRKQKSIKLTDNSEIEGAEQKYLEDDIYYIKPPDEFSIMGKCLHFNWLLMSVKNNPPRKLNITIYDSTYSLCKETIIDEKPSMSFIFREKIVDPCREISRDLPDVVVLNFNDFGSLEKIKKLVNQLVLHRGYFPYFILFNYVDSNSLKLQDELQYHYVVPNPKELSLDFIDKVAILFSKKQKDAFDKRENRKIKKLLKSIGGAEQEMVDVLRDYELYPYEKFEINHFYINCEIEMISMTEFEIEFYSNSMLNIGQCFKVTMPFEMNIVVTKSTYTDTNPQQQIYTGTFYYLNENARERVRRFINELLIVAS